MSDSPTLVIDETFFPAKEGKVYGIHTASNGFFKAFIRHSGRTELSLLVEQPEHRESLKALVRPGVAFRCIREFDRVTRCAMFYNLPRSASFWNRHGQVTRAYSICGINHSLSGTAAYEAMRDLLLAPTQEWDAIICTSRASRSVVQTYIETWSEYIRSRGGVAMPFRPQLPVIPLGVDVEDFAPTPEMAAGGVALRRELGIPAEDLVVLYLGRLNFSSKANPYPMFLGLQLARERLGRPVHLIQAGWYPNAGIETATKTLAAEIAPTVELHHLGSVEGARRLQAFAASDIFMSLSDNIQETFGLTIVEAMAAGLPVVASDWDGYRDTLAHGVTGYLIPTLMAPPGAGKDVGRGHGFMGRPYNRYLLDAAQATAVDIATLVDAVTELGRNPDLRHRMGAAGRQRARDLFDWRIVLEAYAALWDELGAIRRSGTSELPAHHPLHPDPFSLFRSFPTHHLDGDSAFTLAGDWRRRLDTALATGIMRSPSDALVPNDDIRRLVSAMNADGPTSAHHLVDRAGPSSDRAARAIVWLAKAGVIETAT